MSEDTLQNEAVDFSAGHEFDSGEQQDAQIEQSQNEVSELAPEQTEESEAQDIETPEASATRKAVNKQHFKFKQEERLRIETEARLAESERQLALMQEVEKQPIALEDDLPDPYEADYVEKMAKREADIRHNASLEAEHTIYAKQEVARQKEVLQRQHAELTNLAAGYTERARNFGINAQELQEAADTIALFGISVELERDLLDDPDGPLITLALAANPKEIEAIRGMSSFAAVRHIEKNIRKKAVALKPKLSSAKQPPQQVKGGGTDRDLGKFPLSKGATFS